MKNAEVKVKVASFYEAFKTFLSYAGEGCIDENVISSFSELKEKGVIGYQLPSRYWDGNHSHEHSWVSLYRVEDPTLFYVVKYYEEIDDKWEGFRKRTETNVFVPNE